MRLPLRRTACTSGNSIEQDLKRIRDYFGENDRTPFEHWAYSFLDKLIKTKHESSPL
jgi:hypothetical protein